MKLIVGLGNPGVEYVWTRHNAGWLALDHIVAKLDLGEPRMKYHGAFWGPLSLHGERVCLLKPYTYMNLSGSSVSQAVNYFNLDPQEVLIIFDDVALPFERLRMREKGSAGGQKGMISILGALQTLEVPRLRIGIGSPEGPIAMSDWVLSQIPKKQRASWDKISDAVFDGVQVWLKEDIQKAMAALNGFRLDSEEHESR